MTHEPGDKQRMKNKLKVLLFDIETAPNLAWVWDYYEQNVISIEQARKLLCFSYKWLGTKTIHTRYLRDHKEEALLGQLHALFNRADVIVGHNGDKFDIRMSYSFFAHIGLKPPKPSKTIDTLKIAKKKFRFPSNKLEELAKYLGYKEWKKKPISKETWFGCISNKEWAWREMGIYNKHDIVLLDFVFEKLTPWIDLPVIRLGSGCALCGGPLLKRGHCFSKVFKTQRLQCSKCGKWTLGEKERL